MKGPGALDDAWFTYACVSHLPPCPLNAYSRFPFNHLAFFISLLSRDLLLAMFSAPCGLEFHSFPRRPTLHGPAEDAALPARGPAPRRPPRCQGGPHQPHSCEPAAPSY